MKTAVFILFTCQSNFLSFPACNLHKRQFSQWSISSVCLSLLHYFFPYHHQEIFKILLRTVLCYWNFWIEIHVRNRKTCLWCTKYQSSCMFFIFTNSQFVSQNVSFSGKDVMIPFSIAEFPFALQCTLFSPGKNYVVRQLKPLNSDLKSLTELIKLFYYNWIILRLEEFCEKCSSWRTRKNNVQRDKH